MVTTTTTAGRLQDGRLPQEDIDAAADQLGLAFALAGLVSGDGGLQCPDCGTTKKKKVVLKARYWKCFRCGAYGGATRLVQDRLGVGFVEAVDMLLGRQTRPAEDRERIREVAEQVSRVASSGFQAAAESWTWDLYRSVLESEHVSVPKAQEYYGRWHVDPDIVREHGAVYLTEPAKLLDQLLADFGADRVEASGIAVPGKDGKLRLLCGWNYPQVEPAIGLGGEVRNLQFRPSIRQKHRLDAHRAGNGEYVPAFMSIKGSGPKHLIGCGVDRIERLRQPATIMVVEGFKDLLSARTLGWEAYAMPGTGVQAPPGLVQWMAQGGHRILVALDGDETGREAQTKVVEHFTANGFPTGKVQTARMPNGLDLADMLVQKHVRQGCECGTCRTVRNKPAS